MVALVDRSAINTDTKRRIYKNNALGCDKMKYSKTIMTKLINEHRELHDELKKIKVEMGLEKNLAIKALYHSAVADNGPYIKEYQALERLH